MWLNSLDFTGNEYHQQEKKSANIFQLTLRPWILDPDARKTLIWHSDLHFFRGRVPPVQISTKGVQEGGDPLGGGGGRCNT